MTDLFHKQKDKQLWITNISRKRDISIGDLRLTIRIGQSINLLDKKHFKYTEEQIRTSIEKGSLFLRRDVIKVREVAPVVFNMKLEVQQSDRSNLRHMRKYIPVDKPVYEELDFDDYNDDISKYAEENADLDTIDQTPALAVDPKFKNPSNQ